MHLGKEHESFNEDNPQISSLYPMNSLLLHTVPEKLNRLSSVTIRNSNEATY